MKKSVSQNGSDSDCTSGQLGLWYKIGLIKLIPLVMLTHHRCPVSLCLISTDLPIISTLETAATLYQKDNQWFHLLLNQPPVLTADKDTLQKKPNQLLWLEISPYRVIMTMQGQGKLAYRHAWERGMFGVSRFWLNSDDAEEGYAFRLRNFTRSLKLEGEFLPKYLRVEYELWSDKLQLGHYVLHLEIHH